MSTLTVDTYRGLRQIDTASKLIEDNDGKMVAYNKVDMFRIEGDIFYAYVLVNPTATTNAVAVTLKSQRELCKPSAEKLAASKKAAGIKNIMSEGHGDY